MVTDIKLACWIITLNPQAENTLKLSADLAAAGIDAEIFGAVDGRREQPPLMPGEVFDNTLALIRHKKLLTSGELGCYLSHLRAVRQAYDEGYSHVCILEDDVVIEPLFGDVVRLLINDGLDMVRLMSLKIRQRKVLRSLVGAHQLVRPVRGGVGTQAYLMNRVGMKKFIDHASTLYEPIDKVYDHFWLYDLAVYAVEPHVAYELVRESTIAKRPAPESVRPGLLHRLAFHPVKLFFSLRRHAYLRKYQKDLYPASLPDRPTGKSARIRD